MAELPNLGKHCNFASCKQLDFLPFTCDGCTRTFCLEHRVKDIHGCTAENVVAASGEYKGEKGYSCKVADCKNRELTPIWCMKCQLSFCLSSTIRRIWRAILLTQVSAHRHAQDHQCSKQETTKSYTTISKTAEHVNKILETKKAAPQKNKPLNAKASKTAARVALMKMKMTAIGDGSCPEEERLYLKVLPPQGSNTQPQSMFFSKVWSVGRVIDNISDRLKLTNNNNVENAKKLRLFSTLTGDLYPTDCDIGSLLQRELLYSGSSVILEYVDNDCTCISDLTLYSAS